MRFHHPDRFISKARTCGHRGASSLNHRTRDLIEAHRSIVFAALAGSHWIEHRTRWGIKIFVRTARR